MVGKCKNKYGNNYEKETQEIKRTKEHRQCYMMLQNVVAVQIFIYYVIEKLKNRILNMKYEYINPFLLKNIEMLYLLHFN